MPEIRDNLQYFRKFLFFYTIPGISVETSVSYIWDNMRRSKFFISVDKETKSYLKTIHKTSIPSHVLLEKTGYTKLLSSGVFAYCPIMTRVLEKLNYIITFFMTENEFAQKVLMPAMQPTSLWELSGRLNNFKSDSLITFLDRTSKEFCLAPTSEEAVLAMVGHKITYKDLPLILFQISAKFRDEIRPRGGLLRSKEFWMKDAYSFSASDNCTILQYQKMREVYIKIFNRLNLEYVIVKADGGLIASSDALTEEFHVISNSGEDMLLISGQEAYNLETATTVLEKSQKLMLQYGIIDTNQAYSIEEVCSLIKIHPQQAIKCLMFSYYKETAIDSCLVMAIIRGDRKINIAKLKKVLNTTSIEIASIEDLLSLGFSLGTIGPINIPKKAQMDMIIDKATYESLDTFVCGANKPNLHIVMDWKQIECTYTIQDILLVRNGDISCNGTKYSMRKSIEIAHIFCLGTKYSKTMEIGFQNKEGEEEPFSMGCYGIGISRLIATCIEQKQDSHGICLPNCIAPFVTSILIANTDTESVVSYANKLYDGLCAQKQFDVLLDDRNVPLGHKIHESKLLGIASHIVIGAKALAENTLYVELRDGTKKSALPTVADVSRILLDIGNITLNSNVISV